MKKIIISLFLFFGFMIPSAFAIQAPENVNVLEVDNNARVSWSAVSDALFYNVFYGKTSGTKGGYANQTDIVEETYVDVTSLEPGVNYYFSVVSIDMNGDESDFSQEVQLTMGGQGSTFALENVSVESATQLRLQFSRPIGGEDDQREFRISNKQIASQTISVTDSQIDEQNSQELVLDLVQELEQGTEYELVVLDIVDDKGNTIEAGIDALEYFTYNGETKAQDLSNDVEGVLDTQLENQDTDETEDEGVDMNSAGSEKSNMAGVNLKDEDIKQTTKTASNNTDKLPQTGPEVFLLILVALLVSGLILFTQRKHMS